VWILVFIAGALLLVHLASVQHYYWSTRPVVYDLAAPAEAEQYLKSWGEWMDERARVVVKHLGTQAEFEFRKRRYKERPDAIVFRFRNADSARRYFARVRQRFDVEGLPYELELTKKRKQPRALAITLDVADMFSPLVGVRIISVITEELDAIAPGPLQAWLAGSIRRGEDSPSVDLVPPTQGYQSGFSFGYRIGRLLRRMRGAAD
jgi:hypothetical protein